MVKVYYNVVVYQCTCGEYEDRKGNKPYECKACKTTVCRKCGKYGLCPSCRTSHPIIAKIFKIETIVSKIISVGSLVSFFLLAGFVMIFSDLANEILDNDFEKSVMFVLRPIIIMFVSVIFDKWFKSMVGISVGNRDKRKSKGKN